MRVDQHKMTGGVLDVVQAAMESSRDLRRLML